MEPLTKCNCSGWRGEWGQCQSTSWTEQVCQMLSFLVCTCCTTVLSSSSSVRCVPRCTSNDGFTCALRTCQHFFLWCLTMLEAFWTPGHFEQHALRKVYKRPKFAITVQLHNILLSFNYPLTQSVIRKGCSLPLKVRNARRLCRMVVPQKGRRICCMVLWNGNRPLCNMPTYPSFAITAATSSSKRTSGNLFRLRVHLVDMP